MTTNKKYNISISKHENNIDLTELNKWIDVIIKNNWAKKEFKHKVVYIFDDIEDAFKFKMRWSYA